MIRIVTRTRLVALQQDADGARERAREVQGAADRAYAGHLRTVYDLTADAEASERTAEAARADAAIVREILERTETQLANALATVTEQAARIDALSGDLDAMAEAVVLLHYGKLHSLHPDEKAAKQHAASFGVDPDGWGTVPSDRPAVESAWRISPLSRWAVAVGGDAA
ncbi:hypothetical protein DDE74_11260 [Streptomyces lydicus]|uniref:Uncharacterized protein n=1 Tax=Streptomyces lydicus TaxID=47763 RepID=A0A3Q9K0T7_9ACTN|nr:hypothetical protein [Streptomyces lydicus]AZS71452.1 hypothetical protein DDE74_11260 [Streptomyces lydicus]